MRAEIVKHLKEMNSKVNQTLDKFCQEVLSPLKMKLLTPQIYRM